MSAEPLQVKEDADALWQERLKLDQQQLALKYERRIQVGGGGDVGGWVGAWVHVCFVVVWVGRWLGTELSFNVAECARAGWWPGCCPAH